MSPIEFPMNDICSSLTPDRLTLIHRSMGTDESSACKNCGSTRCFFERSNTDMPSIFRWLIVDDFSAFEIALKVLVASSRWIIQLQIFNVFSSLRRGENGKFIKNRCLSSDFTFCYRDALKQSIKFCERWEIFNFHYRVDGSVDKLCNPLSISFSCHLLDVISFQESFRYFISLFSWNCCT